MPTLLPGSLTFFLSYISSFSLLHHQFCPCYQIIPSSLQTYSSEGFDSRKSMTLLGGKIYHHFHFPCGHSDFTILHPTYTLLEQPPLFLSLNTTYAHYYFNITVISRPAMKRHVIHCWTLSGNWGLNNHGATKQWRFTSDPYVSSKNGNRC